MAEEMEDLQQETILDENKVITFEDI